MSHRRLALLVGASVCSLAIVPAGASAKSVSIRVEGATHTLVKTSRVTLGTGSFDKDGNPAHSCTATERRRSARGSLERQLERDLVGRARLLRLEDPRRDPLGVARLLLVLAQQQARLEPASAPPSSTPVTTCSYSSTGACSTRRRASARTSPCCRSSCDGAKQSSDGKTLVTVVAYSATGKTTPVGKASVLRDGVWLGKTDSRGHFRRQAARQAHVSLTAIKRGYARSEAVQATLGAEQMRPSGQPRRGRRGVGRASRRRSPPRRLPPRFSGMWAGRRASRHPACPAGHDAGFGARAWGPRHGPELAGEETVMRLLTRNARVTTRYGGGFVQSIDGLAGGRARRPPRRLVLLRQRDRVLAWRGRREGPRATTGSGGTCATGAPPIACPPWSGPSPSRSPTGRRQAPAGPRGVRSARARPTASRWPASCWRSGCGRHGRPRHERRPEDAARARRHVGELRRDPAAHLSSEAPPPAACTRGPVRTGRRSPSSTLAAASRACCGPVRA